MQRAEYPVSGSRCRWRRQRRVAGSGRYPRCPWLSCQ